MRHKLRRLRTFSWPERWLFARLILVLPLIEIAIRTRGLRWTQERLGRLVPSPPIADGLSPDTLNRVVRAAAGNGLVRATCLRRSLALWWLLRRRGIAAEIKVGARRDTPRFMAHAWVAWADGQSDSPRDLAQLAPFERPLPGKIG
jgi:hypothetical protein